MSLFPQWSEFLTWWSKVPESTNIILGPHYKTHRYILHCRESRNFGKTRCPSKSRSSCQSILFTNKYKTSVAMRLPWTRPAEGRARLPPNFQAKEMLPIWKSRSEEITDFPLQPADRTLNHMAFLSCLTRVCWSLTWKARSFHSSKWALRLHYGTRTQPALNSTRFAAFYAHDVNFREYQWYAVTSFFRKQKFITWTSVGFKTQPGLRIESFIEAGTMFSPDFLYQTFHFLIQYIHQP